MNRLRAGAVLGAAALMIALAGCSNGSDASSIKPEDSPLGKYLSAVWGSELSEKEQQERFERENTQREELMAECMTKQGFEYKPAVMNGGMVFGSGDEWKPEDREWVSQYGYGMVNWPGQERMNETGNEWTDPNEAYVTSLSETERQAYYEALYGPQPTEDQMSEDGSYEWNWETSGCSGEAQHTMDEKNPVSSDEHKPIMDAISDFYSQMDTNPDFADIDAEWAACMADKGYSGFSKQYDARSSFSDELNKYYENQTDYIENDPALKELGEKEVEMALIDLDCREKVNYVKKRAEVSYKLEEQFIADHKAELDALKAAAEQGR